MKALGVLLLASALASTAVRAGDVNDLTWDPYFQVKEALVREGYKCVNDLSRAGKDGMSWNYCAEKKKGKTLPPVHLGAKSDLSSNPVFYNGLIATAEVCEGPKGVEGVLIYGLTRGGWECEPQENGWVCFGEAHRYKLGLHVLAGTEAEKCQIRLNKQ